MSFDGIADEELLLLIRSGRSGAQETLFQRYFEARGFHCRRAAPEISRRVFDWDLNTNYFQIFLKCQNSFQFGKALFKNYFETALRHELYRSLQQHQRDRFNCLSLDDPLASGDGDLTFHDVVSSYEGEDPRLYLNYIEEAYRLKKAPKEITEDILRVALLRGENLTYPEIARRLGLSVKMCKDRYAKYTKVIERIINHGRVDGLYASKKPS